MDDYVGRAIVDQLRELNQNLKDNTEAKLQAEHDLVFEPETEQLTFEQELVHLLNKHGMEKYSNTPDWVLANFLSNVLKQFDCGVKLREGDETVQMMRREDPGAHG